MTDSNDIPNITEFSSGYFLIGALETSTETVVSQSASGVIGDHLYGEIQDTVYNGYPIPITFRHNKTATHFTVDPSSTVANDEIIVEPDIVESDGEQQFLLTKPEYARSVTYFDV